ncbi:MAG: tetratricopeptide repeat protein [Desulfobulbaceae bacterium]|nr:MAG: tetratricopeptide repeat protein [Desulfobulbaceae bacterium]
MKNTLQDIKDIAPMPGASDGRADDPVRADYEEGRRFLENQSYAQAAVSLHNALLGFEERGDEVGVANASNQLGHVCLARQDFEQARAHYQKAWDICEKMQDPMSQIALQKKFIEVYCGLKDYRRATEICLDLLDAYYHNNDPRGTVELLEQMATIYMTSGDRSKAADAYRTVASIHRNFKHLNIAESYEKKAAEIEKAA